MWNMLISGIFTCCAFKADMSKIFSPSQLSLCAWHTVLCTLPKHTRAMLMLVPMLCHVPSSHLLSLINPKWETFQYSKQPKCNNKSLISKFLTLLSDGIVCFEFMDSFTYFKKNCGEINTKILNLQIFETLNNYGKPNHTT